MSLEEVHIQSIKVVRTILPAEERYEPVIVMV
jgi:hypothetical protein